MRALIALWLIAAADPLNAVPPPPPVPSPFSPPIQAKVSQMGALLMKEYDRCGSAFSLANARYVEAIGTPAFSEPWNSAKRATRFALEACQLKRSMLRDQISYFERIVLDGSPSDANKAINILRSMQGTLASVEDWYVSETLLLRELEGFGRDRAADGRLPLK